MPMNYNVPGFDTSNKLSMRPMLRGTVYRDLLMQRVYRTVIHDKGKGEKGYNDRN